jgi:hypothetical protein
METKSYTTIDRKAQGWPSGPWDDEPDKMQWPDPATGLPCLAVRHPSSGHWCGYVGVPEAHPWHGKGYNDTMDVEVHWELTFAASCQPGSDESKGVCHVPAPGEPSHVWWFGFDCAHLLDFSPRDRKLEIELGYPFQINADRSLAYVQQECASLAAQLKKAA